MADSTTSETTTTAEARTIGDEAGAKWADLMAWSLAWSRGEQECGNCSGTKEWGGKPCTDCDATGVCSGVEPFHTLGRQAGNAAGDLEETIGSVVGVIASARVADERHAAGVESVERVAPEARALFDELAALAPTLARIAVLLERIDVAQADVDAEDPREQRYAANANAWSERLARNAAANEESDAVDEAAQAVEAARGAGDVLHQDAVNAAREDYAEGEGHRAECDRRDRESGPAHYLSDVVANDLAEAVGTIEVSCLTIDKLNDDGDDTTTALVEGLRAESKHVARAAALSRAIYNRLEDARTSTLAAAE